MTQQESADYLSVSVRSLQRFVQQGHLTVQYEPGKTRPVPVYDAAEVDALKASRCWHPRFQQQHAQEAKKRPFGFRLVPADIEKLTAEAARYGLTPGEYARHLLQLGMESGLQAKVTQLATEMTALRQEVVALTQALAALKKEFADTTEIVLEFAGMEPADARHWTNINLRARRKQP